MYVLRWDRGRVVWLVWLALVVVLTARLFYWQFRAPGPRAFAAMAVAAPLLPLALWLWHKLRTHRPAADALVVVPAGVVCLFRAPAAVAVALFFTASAIALGGYLLDRLGASHLPLAVRALAGFAAFSYVLFGVGLAGGYYPAVFAAMMAVPVLLFARVLRDDIRRFGPTLRAWTKNPDSRSGFISTALFFAAGLALLTAACAVTPTIVHDALMFHLSLVKTFSASHSLAPPATIPYGYFPQGGELIMLAAYGLAGQTAAQMMEPVFFLLGLAVSVRIGARAGKPAAAAVAGAVFAASVPFVHWSGSVMKNDLMLAAYVLASIDCVLAWFESRHVRYLVCSAFLLAAAFGVKHIALFAAVPLAMLWAYAVARQPRKIIAAAAIIAVFVPFSSLWVLRAWLATGNPTYPERASRAITSPRSRTNYWSRKLSLPYTLQFEGQKHFESPSPYPLGFTMLFFLPLVVVLRRRHPSCGSRAVAFFTGTYLIYWGAVIAVLRYAIPPFVAAASALGSRAEALSRFTRTATAAMAYTFLFSLSVIVGSEMRPSQVSFLGRRIGADEYLRRELPPYGAMRYLATHAGTDDHAIDIDAYAVAYSHNPARVHLLFRDPRVYTAGDVRTLMAVVPAARWIVVPNNSPALASAIGESGRAALAYRDEWFSVWWLELPSTPREAR